MLSLLNSLIYPVFVKEGKGVREPISSMRGIYIFSTDILIEEVKKFKDLGITKFLLFGVPDAKDERGSGAYDDGNVVARAVTLLKMHFQGIVIMTDICLCSYVSHGHCGILVKNGKDIDNRATLSALAKIAVSHARAGADYVAPSAMAKGQVRAIRGALNKNGHRDTKIMGYSAKYASQFYGPFREVADSAPKFGDRRGYQLDYADRERALEEVGDDIKEGADIVMVKPALPYLDIIRETKNRFNHILAAYNVSGEYAMVKAGSSAGFWQEKEIAFEIINSIKRAGADIVITYHAPDIARWLR